MGAALQADPSSARATPGPAPPAASRFPRASPPPAEQSAIFWHIRHGCAPMIQSSHGARRDASAIVATVAEMRAYAYSLVGILSAGFSRRRRTTSSHLIVLMLEGY